jgi:hypothetical protein
MIWLTILAAWLLADFMTGLVHWSEDRLLVRPSKFHFIETIRKDNDMHHWKPTSMLRFTVSENINTSVVIAWPIAVLCAIVGAPDFVSLAFVFAGFGNLVHRWTHTPKYQIPRVVRALQFVGLMCTGEQHGRHHFNERGLILKSNTTEKYCVMTCYLNPILDGLGFWKILERLLVKERR